MKILYGAGNFTGSNIAAARFIKNTEHEVRIAAHYKNHKYLESFDWCLDPLYKTKIGFLNYFTFHHGISGPHVNHEMADLIINETTANDNREGKFMFARFSPQNGYSFLHFFIGSSNKTR